MSEELTGMKWLDALRTPAFWVFALASSTYGLVSSGISLFNESILTERGFDYQTFYNSLIIVAMTGLLGNFIGGWLTDRWRMNRLMAVTMFLLMIALIALPSVQTVAHVMAYATVMGLAGGFVTVLFFAFWSRVYGRRELGRIQGSAQALTVFASAVGPLLLAFSKRRHRLLRRLLLRHRHPRRPPRLRLLGRPGAGRGGQDLLSLSASFQNHTMFADAALAARIDRAEARLSAGVADVVHARRPDYRTIVLPISGGLAVYASPNSPVNKVIGLGFDGPLDLDALEQIEREWRARDEAVRVELSILADASVPVALSERGYHVHGYENVALGAIARRSDDRARCSRDDVDETGASTVARRTPDPRAGPDDRAAARRGRAHVDRYRGDGVHASRWHRKRRR